jgi:hypothetical protein
MLTKLHAYWNSLPHPVQAVITLFTTMALTTLSKELQQLLSGDAAFTWPTLRHDIAFAVMSGAAAVQTFYMIPNRKPQPTDATPTSESK